MDRGAGRRRTAVMAALLVVSGWATPARAADPPVPASATFVALDPTTGLVDGDPLTVRGRGFAPGDYFAVAQCRPQITTPGDSCDKYHYIHAGPGGGFTLPDVADVILDLPSGPRDCRVEACEVVALRFEGTPLRRIPLQYDPAGPDPFRPTATATPSTDLVDGDEVHITGDVLRPGTTARGLNIQQCRAPVNSWPEDCDAETTHVRVTAEDPLDVTFEVDTRLLTWGDTYDCRTGGCALWVGPRIEPSRAAIIPLTFDPSGPIGDPPEATLTQVTPGPLSDGHVVRATYSGYEDDYVSIHQCPAGVDDVGRCEATNGGAPFGTHGQFDLSVRTIIRTRQHTTGPDCRVSACVVRVRAFHGPSFELPLPFDPSLPPLHSRLDVAPHTALVGGQTVSVHGAELPMGHHRRWMAQCVGPITADGLRGRCGPNSYRDTDFDGPTEDWSFTVVRVMRTSREGRVDCRVRHCRLILMDVGRLRAVGSDRLHFA